MKNFNIKKEHEAINRELIELETIIDTEENNEVNHANLSHVFKKLHDMWNTHEDKEEKFFEENFSEEDFPIEKMKTSHRLLKGHLKVIHDAIKSGDESEIIASLDTDGRMLVDKLRAHMKEEEELLDKIKL